MSSTNATTNPQNLKFSHGPDADFCGAIGATVPRGKGSVGATHPGELVPTVSLIIDFNNRCKINSKLLIDTTPQRPFRLKTHKMRLRL